MQWVWIKDHDVALKAHFNNDSETFYLGVRLRDVAYSLRGKKHLILSSSDLSIDVFGT